MARKSRKKTDREEVEKALARIEERLANMSEEEKEAMCLRLGTPSPAIVREIERRRILAQPKDERLRRKPIRAAA